MAGGRDGGRAATAGGIALLLAMLVAAITASACTASDETSAASTSTTRAAPKERGRSPSPYVTARFTATASSHRFGQDPTYTADGRVLSSTVAPEGTQQVYVSELDGSEGRCLTCGQPGPNGYALERPQGDWILFCSWRGNPVVLGRPCLGGYGSDLYLMRPDGTDVTRLTAPGRPFDSGDVYDNYHPTWSPDGRRIAWTHVAFRAPGDGGTRWEVVVADVDLDGRTPQLGEPAIVAPAENAAYETQSWSPDSSTLLFTRFGGRDAAEGWMASELWRARLAGGGASLRAPKLDRLTDGHPGWDEQAAYTPDGQAVVFMSSRGTPTWYQSVVTLAQAGGHFPPDQNTAFGPFFIATISDPRFRTDLYLLDLATRSIRRLTDLDSVIPEFTFDPTGRRLLWSEGNRERRTMIGEFDLPEETPTWDPPPVDADDTWVGAPRSGTEVEVPEPPPGPAEPLADAAIPPEIVAGAQLYAEQLAGLAPAADAVVGGPAG